MTRSRINGNFIDKTFTIEANILLWIIPTTSGEKEALTYYRDGAIWLCGDTSEDVVLISERLVYKDIYTSFHIRNMKFRLMWQVMVLKESLIKFHI